MIYTHVLNRGLAEMTALLHRLRGSAVQKALSNNALNSDARQAPRAG